MKKTRSFHPVIDRLRFLVAFPISYLLLPLHLIGQTAPVVVAPNSGNTRAYDTTAGTVVVDINTPNAAGLSHNKYTNFNVTANGVVLNNATPTQFTTASQLAGSISSNFNLKPNAAAAVILNEVVAPNATTLAGFTEVAGTKADVVIANPYGITVNGAGFINADQVTLAIGTPVLGTNGSLSALQVDSGELLITGDGLNAGSINYLNLLGRSVRLDGSVYAGELAVSTGPQTWDYATRTATSRTASGTAPTYAIDSTLVGGMYANRIRLIANEAGVGVRLLGDAAATTNDFTIDAAGKVQLLNRSYAGRDFRATATGGVELTGTNTTLTAARDLTLAGGSSALTVTDTTIVAGRDATFTGASLTDTSATNPSSANRYAAGNFTLTTTGDTALTRSIYASGGSLNLTANNATLNQLAALVSGADSAATSRNLTVTARAGNLTLNDGQLISNARLGLSATGTISTTSSSTSAGIQSAGAMTLTAATLNHAGQAYAGDTLSVTAPTLNNSGGLQSANAGTVTSTTLTNSGALTGGSLALTTGSLTNSGQIVGALGVLLNASGNVQTTAGSAIASTISGRPILLTAGNLTNAGYLQAAGILDATVTATTNNTGFLITLLPEQGGAGGALNLTTGTLLNSGTAQSGGTFTINTTTPSVTGVTNSGLLASARTFRVTTPTRVSNSGTIFSDANLAIDTTGGLLTLINSGRIQSRDGFALGGTAPSVAFQQEATGVTLAGGPLTGPFTTVTNAGTLQTGATLNLTATTSVLNQAGASILTAGAPGLNFTLTTPTLTNAGTLQSSGAFTAAVSGNLTNTGNIITLDVASGGSGGNLTVTAGNFANTGTLQSGGDLILNRGATAPTLTNAGLLSASGNVLLNSGGAFTNTSAGRVLAGRDVSVVNDAVGNFTVTNSGTLQAGRDFLAGTNAQRVALANLGGGVVLGTRDVTVTASTFGNDGTFQSVGNLTLATSGAATNTANLLTTGTGTGALTLNLASFTNSGTVSATGNLSSTIAGLFSNTGVVQGNATVSLAAATFNNTATGNFLALAAAGPLTANATTFNNDGRLITAGAATLLGTTFTNTGTVQSAGALTGNFLGNVTNSGAVATTGSGAAGQLNFTAGGTLANSGTIDSAANAALTAGANLTNSGNLTATGNLALVATNSLTNANGATILAGTDLSLASADATNNGLLQSGRHLSITPAAVTGFTNAASGRVIAGANLTLTPSGSALVVDNAGLLQAAGLTTIGLATPNAQFTNAAGAKLITDSLNFTGNFIRNSGTISTTGSALLTALTFENIGSASKAVFASNSGSATFNLTTALNNEGMIYSGGPLTIATGNLLNTSTGGLSAAGNLTINATGGLTNHGALYSAANLATTVTGNVLNGATGTIDTAGNYASTSAKFTNSGQIDIGGALDISARTFENVYSFGPLTRIQVGPPTPTGSWQYFNPSIDISSDNETTRLTNYIYIHYAETVYFVNLAGRTYGYTDSDLFFYNTDQFVDANGNRVDTASIAAAQKPQIAANSIAIRNFDTAVNYGFISTPGNLVITGNAGSSFTNDALSLSQRKYHVRLDTAFESISLTPFAAITNQFKAVGVRTEYGIDPLGVTEIFSSGAGLRAGNLIVTNVGSLTNLGTPFAAAPAATAATATDADTAASRPLFASVGLTAANARATNAGALAANRLTAASVNAVARTRFSGSFSLGSLTLKLPTNPNGFFVTSPNPNAKFRVVVNADLGIANDAIGSDFLAEQVGYDPDQIQQRLGDPAYETYLVRQQLIDQLGSRFLTGQTDETEQMKTMMLSGAAEARRLGLVWGEEPSAAQLANLTEDIIWMVTEVIDGSPVLVPRVFLSAKTKSMFDPKNANIAASGNTVLKVGDLTNTGGNIASGGTTLIVASGNITNSSGTISGNNVGLKAGGTITNETLTSEQITDNKQHFQVQTTIGRTGGINASNNLVLDAGQDIKVKGADINAGNNALIKAGGDITVDTITKTTATTTSSSSSGLFSSSSKSTTVTTVNNIASNINIGGNLKIQSGGNTTLAGSNLDVGGSLKTDVGGSFNVVDRHDTTTVQTTTSSSGFGQNGGIYGSKSVTSTDVTSTSVGSKINVGGNADIKAQDDVNLVGSKLKVEGDANIDATNINVLEGRNTHTNVTVTTTSTFGVFTDSGSSSGANSGGSAGNGAAQGTASANASGSGDLTIGMRNRTTVEKTSDSTGSASSLEIGGNANLKAKNAVTVQGSDVKAGGDLNITATDINVLASQDTHDYSRDTKTTTTGLSFSGSGDANAAAQGDAASNQRARGSASAAAEGEGSVGLKVQVAKDTYSESTSTARVSTLTAGGNMTRTATNKITDVGTQIDAGGNFSQSATTIEALAATSSTASSASSDITTARVGVGAQASGSAAGGGGTYGGGKGDVDGKAAVGVTASVTHDAAENTKSSTTSTVVSIKSGGTITSVSKETTRLEGTKIETTGGDVNLTAGSLVFDAAKDTTTESNSSSNQHASAMLGVGVSAGGGKGLAAEAKGGAATAQDTTTTSTAVTGSITSAGKINIKTSGDTTLVGTNLDSQGTTNINAGGNVNLLAAQNTETTSSSEKSIDASVSTLGGGKGDKGTKAGFEVAGAMADDSSSKTTAVTGTIKSGGGLNITAGKDATLEGTKIDVTGDTKLAAGGNVNLLQATSTETSKTSEADFNLAASKNKKGADLDAGGGFGRSSSSSTTAETVDVKTTGSLTIQSGKDTTLQGSNLSSGGSTTIAAGGKVDFQAKTETSSSNSQSVEANVSVKTGDDGKKSGGVSAGASFSDATTQTGGSITSGGPIKISSGSDTTLVGTQVKSDSTVTVQAGGQVKLEEAKSTSSSGGVGLDLGQKEIKRDGTNERQSAAPANGVAVNRNLVVDASSGSSSQQTTLSGTNVTVQSNTPAAPGGIVAAPKAGARPTARDTSGSDAPKDIKVDAPPSGSSVAPAPVGPRPTTKPAPKDTQPKPDPATTGQPANGTTNPPPPPAERPKG